MLKWWNAHRNQFPLMSQAVREVLCVPASSSASERALGIGGLICSQAWPSVAKEDRGTGKHKTKPLCCQVLLGQAREAHEKYRKS